MAPKAKKQTPTKVVAPAPTPVQEPDTPTTATVAVVAKASARRGVKLPVNVSSWCRTMITSAELESTKKSLLIMGTTEGDLVAVVEEENNTYTPVFNIHGAHSGAVRTLALSTGPFTTGNGAVVKTSKAAELCESIPDTMVASGGADGSILVIPLLPYLEAALQPSITTSPINITTDSLIAQGQSKILRLINIHHLPVTGLSFMCGAAGGSSSNPLIASVSLDGRVGIHRITFPSQSASLSTTALSTVGATAKQLLQMNGSGTSSTSNTFIALPAGNSRFVSVGFPLTSLYDPLVVGAVGSALIETASSSSAAHFLSGTGGPLILVAGTKIALVDVSALLIAEIRDEEKESATAAVIAVIDKTTSVTVGGGAVIAAGSDRNKDLHIADTPLRTKPPVASGITSMMQHFGGAVGGSDMVAPHVSKFGGRCIFMSWFPTHSPTTTDLPVNILPSGTYCNGPMFVTEVPRSHFDKSSGAVVAEKSEEETSSTSSELVELLMVGIVNSNSSSSSTDARQYVQFSMADLARAVTAFKLPSSIVGIEGSSGAKGQHPSLTASEGTVVSIGTSDLASLVTKAKELRQNADKELVARATARASHNALAEARKQALLAEEEAAADAAAHTANGGAEAGSVAEKEIIDTIKRRLEITVEELYSMEDSTIGAPAAPVASVVGPTIPAGVKRPRTTTDDTDDAPIMVEATGFKNVMEVERATMNARAYLKYLKAESDTLYRDLAATKKQGGGRKSAQK